MVAPTPSAVFLSYAREDTDAARRICDALRAFGIEVWFDQSELRGGDSWDAKIRRQIKECALFIPVISAHTQERHEGYFRLEWDLARQRTHLMAHGVPFIVPVVLDGTEEGNAMVPERFRDVQWVRLRQGVPTADFVEQVKVLLARPKTPPAIRAETPAQPDRPARGMRWTASALAVVVLALAAFIILRPQSSAPQVDPKSRATSEPALTGRGDTGVADKSIAVLPFVNLSPDRENEFFADGIHEDILTHLQNIRQLRVVSRGSVMAHRGSQKKAQELGRELGVAYLLAGSIRRDGQKVRIAVQLVNARTDAQVWSPKPYDRELRDIFAIQSEIAEAIAAELKAVISPEEKSLIERRPTDNLAAYDLVLKAREQRKRHRAARLHYFQIKVMLEESLRLDPNLVDAWAELADIESRIYQFEVGTDEQLARVRKAIETSVRLAPDSPEVVRSLGEYYYRCHADHGRALIQFEKLTRLRPNDERGFALIAAVRRAQGNWVSAQDAFSAALKLDPGNRLNASDLVSVLQAGRRFDEARVIQQRVVEQSPADSGAAFELAYLSFLATGAREEVERFFASLPATEGLSLRLRWALTKGDVAEAVRLDLLGARKPAAERSLLERSWDAGKMAVVFAAQRDLPAARAELGELPDLMVKQLKVDPKNAHLSAALGQMEAMLGRKKEAFHHAQRAVDLVPVSRHARQGAGFNADLAFVAAWTGEKDRALAEYARLLRTVYGLQNVHEMKHHPDYTPLREDPRFQTLLNDPRNNAPLF